MVPVSEHLPVVIAILLSDDDLAAHHKVELLGVVTERMLFGDLEGVLCVVEEREGDWLSPLEEGGTFDLRDLLGRRDVLVC